MMGWTEVLMFWFTGLCLFLFMLVLGFNLGVRQAAIHGAPKACEMIRLQLIDCSSLVEAHP